jgi:glycosyltransferase involved in cell wall biosynthesis
MSKKKKVVVIGHEASLSGAPILLLNLFRLLIEKGVVDVQFVIRKDGPLTNEYKKVAPTVVLKSSNYGNEKNIFDRLVNFVKNKIRLGIFLLNAFNCDYLFFNTVVNGKLQRWLYFHRKPVITYVHELEKVIDLYLKQNDAVLPLTNSKVIAFPSIETREILYHKYKIPNNKLRKLQYYFSFSKEQYNATEFFERRSEFRKKFGIEKTDFVVGAMGTVSERKGIDLYIDVCRQVVSAHSSVKFIWIGSFESKETQAEIESIIKGNRLEAKLIFTGPVDYSIYNFAAFDILFLSSREDTYPLVVLEAAMMKIPSICFSDSGGIIEFVSNDAGWIINNFSTRQVVDKIIELQKDNGAVHLRGNHAFNKVLDLHCNANLIIGQYNCIVECLELKL